MSFLGRGPKPELLHSSPKFHNYYSLPLDSELFFRIIFSMISNTSLKCITYGIICLLHLWLTLHLVKIVYYTCG